MSVRSGYPTLVFHVSQFYNLLYYLNNRMADGPAQATPLDDARRQILRLRNYTPGAGLWGFFEEAMAASQTQDEVKQSLELAGQRLQVSISDLISRTLPAFDQEWQQISSQLHQRRDQLVKAWYPREQALMALVEKIFATPWPGEDAERIDVHMVYDVTHAARSRPLTLGVNGHSAELVICDLVHELLHRNSFGTAKGSLWSKLQLFYFSTGVPAWLGHEITHTVITWAACAMTAKIWEVDFEIAYSDFYRTTTDPQQSSLDAMAKVWPAFEAGEVSVIAFIKEAVAKISRVTTSPPAAKAGGLKSQTM